MLRISTNSTQVKLKKKRNDSDIKSECYSCNRRALDGGYLLEDQHTGNIRDTKQDSPVGKEKVCFLFVFETAKKQLKLFFSPHKICESRQWDSISFRMYVVNVPLVLLEGKDCSEFTETKEQQPNNCGQCDARHDITDSEVNIIVE